MSGRIHERLMDIRERIEAAAARSGRNADDVTIVAVSKTMPLEAIEAAIAAGVTHFGENRVQEAQEKFGNLPAGVTRHLIGHLQTNKVRFVGELFDMVHSIDRLRVAEALGRRLAGEGRTIDCLIQVNVAEEATKHGVRSEEALELVADVANIEALNVKGLMTMAPLGASEKELREVFGGLRQLAESIAAANIAGVQMEHLSMGMSADYEIAVEEGATMVRIGRGIFG